MIVIKDVKGNKTNLDPNKIDIMLASHKYVELYSEGKMYLHDESIKTLYLKYGKDFLVIRRGLLVHKDFIKTISNNDKPDRFIIPIRNEPRYPNELYISRRNLSPVIKELKELGKFSC